MKNFSWKKYLYYLLPALILLTAIVLNIYYIPKYYEVQRQNRYEGTYTVTILGQDENYNVFFTKGLNVKHANNLGAVLSKYPDDFGLNNSTWGNFLSRVGNITLSNPKEAYFSIQSGDNNQKNAAHIHPECREYENNACSSGIDYLKLMPNVDNVFRFVITKINQ
ncbi:hypothetical protein [Spiroplasma melliferum]|uniref:Uncharacterized protein n=2 Tax=Spiroplasma melliferum TaxID=2134 RepID=A0AAI9T372_SPIME|nr:hypothetical protein [Spiroplasma melliferum]ELL44943.1 hypothetical protein SMIPMB4A_v3c0750 [Spiroplasma melliferum IPMB4A]KAI92583.1 hypothetical protein SPM_000455 [Spiroplasma melliferum KC3]QCO24173.1 hypothetical protein SRED_002657 [Spiroplasma melliferum]